MCTCGHSCRTKSLELKNCNQLLQDGRLNLSALTSDATALGSRMILQTPPDERWTVIAMRALSHKRCLFEARMRQHHAIILSLRHRRDDSPLVVRRIQDILHVCEQAKTNKPPLYSRYLDTRILCDVWSRQRIEVSLQNSHVRIDSVGLSAEMTALDLVNYHTRRRCTPVSALPSLNQQLRVGQL